MRRGLKTRSGGNKKEDKENPPQIVLLRHSRFAILLSVPITRPILEQTLKTPVGERAYKIVETLTDAGYEAWWVGGAVRDLLKGAVPHDIDITTSATPDQVIALFKRSTTEGKAMGSVKIVLGDDAVEVTTFREDDEASDGRHPESVVFTTSNEKDARRRDFSVNAIYFQPQTLELFDPYGGEADVKERLVEFIGEPAVRIKHDALRILRAVRLRAAMNGQYHPATYAALRELAHLVDGLSGQRIGSEIEKILKGSNPERAFEDLWELGILSRIFPELHACKGIPQPADYHHEGDVWDHTMQLLKNFTDEDDIDVRIAGLFHDCGKAETFSQKERIRFDHHASISADLVTKALKRLQYPKARVEKIDWLVRHHMSMTFLDMPEDRKAHWYHHPWFADLLKIFRLDIAGTTPADYQLYEAIVKDWHRFLDTHPRPAKPLLSGHDVMEILGLGSGPEVGRLTGLILEAQKKKEISTKAEAKALLKTLVAKKVPGKKE